MRLNSLQSNNHRLLRKIIVVATVFSLVHPYPAMIAFADPDSALPESTASTIMTGDALAESDIENTVNVNAVQTIGATSSGEDSQPTEETTLATTEGTGEATAAESATAESTEPDSSTDAVFGTTAVSTDNSALVLNYATTTADTGENIMLASDDGSIYTGTAYAGANIINLVNTTTYNSGGFIALLNSFFGQAGTIDLRDYMSGEPSSLCDPCEGTTRTIGVQAANTATITNSVIVRANTGGNTAEGDGALIDTGNAYAAANIVNIANTTIVDSNYMMMVFNNFGTWNGDLIFPNAEFFRRLFFGQGLDCCVQSLSISTSNSASIDNTLTTQALTGDNAIEGEGGAIVSGDSLSASNVVNQVNTNLMNRDSFAVLLSVHGDWNGGMYNLPEGILWRRTAAGVMLYTDPDFDLEGSGQGQGNTELSVDTDNNADIENNIQVYALTGDNQISGNGGVIQTGNAYGVSNVINVANTNIIGRNWSLALLNIFGDWNGDLSFGQPDLWLGTKIDSNSGRPGTTMVFRYTIWNHGDADAHDVVLRSDVPSGFLTFDPLSRGESDTTYRWNIGTVRAGEFVDLAYDARVSSEIPHGQTEISTSAAVSAHEPDANSDDNTDDILAYAFNYGSDLGGSVIALTPDPKLIINKTNDATAPFVASTTVKYTITIRNEGGLAYHAALIDTLKNERDEVVNEQAWDLDTIAPNEEITVDYEMFFDEHTSPGVYTNHAQVKAIGRHESLDPFYGYFSDSNVATSTVTIYASKLLSWDYAPVIYATSTTNVVSATVSSDEKPTKPLPPVDSKELPFWMDPGASSSLPPYVFLADTLSRNDEITPSVSASAFSSLFFPWSRDFDSIVFMIIVVFLYLARESYPEYRMALRSFFSL